MHSPHNVLPADGAFIHPLATLGAGDHVAALKQNAVDHGVHADPAEVVVVNRQWTALTILKDKKTKAKNCEESALNLAQNKIITQ